MAVDMFLKIDGIDGESNQSKHKGELEILSFSWGIQQSSSTGGAGSGKVAVQEFTVVKQMNNSSPHLMEKCCTGEHIPSVQLTLASKEKPIEYMKIKLTDVLISSYQTGGAGAGGSVPMDQVSFSFRSVDIQAADNRGQFSQVSCDFAKGEGEVIGKIGHNH